MTSATTATENHRLAKSAQMAASTAIQTYAMNVIAVTTWTILTSVNDVLIIACTVMKMHVCVARRDTLLIHFLENVRKIAVKGGMVICKTDIVICVRMSVRLVHHGRNVLVVLLVIH
ncbi:MAG: hypothetical protein QF704_06235 [Anaerolineales bacterium]|nr:hypothetical protein [Anaerolineales bacterium]